MGKFSAECTLAQLAALFYDVGGSWLDLLFVLKCGPIIFLIYKIGVIIDLKRAYHLGIDYAFFEVLVIL